VERMSVSERWMVSLGRSLMRDARLIAMDEPTASFTEQEAERLFAIIGDLTAQGVAVLYVSHRLDEVLHVSRDVTVLRNGRLVDTFAANRIDRARLTQEIVGREVAELAPADPPPAAAAAERELVLKVDGLSREPRVRGVSLEVRRGEVLGIAGLVGAGRTELARLLFGADAATGGQMWLEGRAFKPRSPYDAIRQGVALVPEERRSEGLLLRESVAFNINLATAGANRRGRLPLLSPGRARAAARELAQRFRIKVESVDQPVSALSGGNQQKVVVAKCVRAAPKLLILDEPTVGVDVGARKELYDIIAALAAARAAVIVISSDFEELAICERVAVMRDGRITHVVVGAAATKDRLTELCYADAEEDAA
jgi:ribose transport system ATP-binding protein